MRATNLTFQVITRHNHNKEAVNISNCLVCFAIKGTTKKMRYLILVKYEVGWDVRISIHWLVGNHGMWIARKNTLMGGIWPICFRNWPVALSLRLTTPYQQHFPLACLIYLEHNVLPEVPLMH